MIKIKCDYCDKQYQFSEENLWKKAKCKCWNILSIDETTLSAFRWNVIIILCKILSLSIYILAIWSFVLSWDGINLYDKLMISWLLFTYWTAFYKSSWLLNKQQYIFVIVMLLLYIIISIFFCFGSIYIWILTIIWFITLILALQKWKDYWVSFKELLNMKL